MNLTFPTFSLSGPLISLDDDETSQTLLKHFLPKQWEVKCFSDQGEFAAEMEDQLRLQAATHHDLASLLTNWREQGTDLIAAVMRFWRHKRERPANLLLIDFQMPVANGVDLLSHEPLRSWEGGKLLLTAYAEDSVAVDVFNRHLIGQFIHKVELKQHRTLTVQLIAAIKREGNALFERKWASQVSVEQLDVLQAAKAALLQIIQREEWEDYAVIGQPFGILGRVRESYRWLQLETEDSLISLEELLENTGASEQDRAAVRDRKSIMAVELGSVLPVTNSQPAIPLTTNGMQVWAAMFDVDLKS
jgi:CheY-like chemotaxis protein